ncbi:maleylacetoacetate isomerase [uncultured Tateyamaria sp.]|uniref:maleylacetoacetate isomerase n=1 Tax=uncultured Tateyamaria sp. TaxID=455651 RepID=UPI00262C1044|nr:maleylacetoacetate isomerase [uncultured Tateyamaria sp.]
MKLYSYWRSTTSYRVRIALHLKGVAYETVAVDLVAGVQASDDYAALNPIKGVPTLITDEGHVITQSMAILDYLDHLVPNPALLPRDDLTLRAQVLAAAMVFATDVHPVNNLKVVKKVRGLSDEATGIAWMQDWMRQGFAAFDALIARDTPFSFGDTPSLADICLVAQAYNAHRWGVDLSPYPRLQGIEARCLALPAFQAAKPEHQKDSTS